MVSLLLNHSGNELDGFIRDTGAEAHITGEATDEPFSFLLVEAHGSPQFHKAAASCKKKKKSQ